MSPEILSRAEPANYFSGAAMSSEILTRSEAADYLGMSPNALAAHATRGTGPRFAKLSGRTVRYRREDLDAWVASKLRTSTRELSRETPGVDCRAPQTRRARSSSAARVRAPLSSSTR